jgi:hypothetical protein
MNGHSDLVGMQENGEVEFNEQSQSWEEIDHHENPTQEEQVLEYLTNIGTITQRKATIVLSVGRLAARIYNLIHRDGHPISKRMITVKNQFGKKCSVAEYYLEEDK